MKQFPTHIVACGGIVENEKGEVLLVKHINGYWSFPGGQVEIGENLMEALQREIWEEAGAKAEVVKLLGVSSNTVSYPGYNGYETVPTNTNPIFTHSLVRSKRSAPSGASLPSKVMVQIGISIRWCLSFCAATPAGNCGVLMRPAKSALWLRMSCLRT